MNPRPHKGGSGQNFQEWSKSTSLPESFFTLKRFDTSTDPIDVSIAFCFQFFEASAKDNINVKQVFERLVNIICDKMNESLDGDPSMLTNHKGPSLQDTPPDAQSGCGYKQQQQVTRSLKLVSALYSFLALGGGGSAGFGIWSQITKKPSEVLKIVDDATLNMILSLEGPTLIALGCILTLMSLIGFFGTLKRKSWMILVFFIVVLIIFIIQVIAAVFILLPNSVKENALSSLGGKLVQNLQDNYKQGSKIKTIWDETMNKLKCCGYKGYDDFILNTNYSYPAQCCGEDLKLNCTIKNAAEKKVKGCIHVLLDENIPLSGALAFLIGILEIIALVVSLNVYRCLRRLPDLPGPL
ncbi:hypothetical protein Q8A67_005113 [Cirrhinus molitorella]|uniref:Tetraspanin n=1 Tax=Cirrhinus molitorella TaxID=172907 RepID=A0AA88PZF4_9TELE|nr:hypothetical protein Q8A67_005113 [Cirrhinus molitorella]